MAAAGLGLVFVDMDARRDSGPNPDVDLAVSPEWKRTGYKFFPFAAWQAGAWWVLRFNFGFPEHDMYTLFVDGQVTVDVTGAERSELPLVASVGALDRFPEALPVLDGDTALNVVSQVAAYADYGSEHNDPCLFCSLEADGLTPQELA